MADHIPTVRQRRLAQALRELRHDAGLTQDSVERRVAARLARQKELLGRPAAPGLGLVLNEAVLRRLVGGAAAMAAQLRALAEAARRPPVMLQVLPFSAGAHAAQEGGFVLIKFPEEADPDAVYVEGIMGDLYLESEVEVKRYQSAFERIQAVALGPKESSAFISALARELSWDGEKLHRQSRAERAGRSTGGHVVSAWKQQ